MSRQLIERKVHMLGACYDLKLSLKFVDVIKRVAPCKSSNKVACVAPSKATLNLCIDARLISP